MRKRLQSNRPFSVQSWPGYYGWVILFFGTLGMVAAIPGSPPGMSVFSNGMRKHSPSLTGSVAEGLIGLLIPSLPCGTKS